MIAGASTAKFSAKVTTKIRSFAMEKMEDLLFNWIQDQDQRHIRISLAETKSKAISLYEMTKNINEPVTEKDTNETFKASNGWWEGFKLEQKQQNAKQCKQTDIGSFFRNKP